MNPDDQLRLARSLQFRELLAALFDDDTPWGESVPMQALADHLEQDGRLDLADIIRGRFQIQRGQLQVIRHRNYIDPTPRFPASDRGHLKNSRNARVITHVVELQGITILGESDA